MKTSKDLFEKYANPKDGSQFININGTDIHYRDEGSGFPVLLIHGTSSSLHTFDGWAEELRKKYRVLRFDMPGFGLSGPMADGNYNMDNFLKFIDDFLAKIKVDQCHIAGSSLGGLITWEFTVKYSQRVNKMILIDAAGYMSEESLPFIYKVARRKYGRYLFLCARNRKVFARFNRGVYGNYKVIHKSVFDRYYDLFFREENLEAFLRLAKTDPFDHTRSLTQITSPTLILWGDLDKWVKITVGYNFDKLIPKTKLIIYRGLGHIPMEEDPALTVKDVIAFLDAKV